MSENKYHQQASGAKAGQWVICTAKTQCRLGGEHISREEADAANVWNVLSSSPIKVVKGTADLEDKCLYCLEETSSGSGKWVNRIPAGRSLRDLQEEIEEDVELTAKFNKLFATVNLSKVVSLDGYMCEDCYACDDADCDHDDCL